MEEHSFKNILAVALVFGGLILKEIGRESAWMCKELAKVSEYDQDAESNSQVTNIKTLIVSCICNKM